jgi:hypothetical protein
MLMYVDIHITIVQEVRYQVALESFIQIAFYLLRLTISLLTIVKRRRHKSSTKKK